MKTLVVYYSLEGNTKILASKIAETLNADIIELKTSKQYPSEGFKKYVFGGKSVVFGEKPKLTNTGIDLSLYDTIVIGTPIWASNFTPPIKSFISEYKIQGKRIALFACHRGGRSRKMLFKAQTGTFGQSVYRRG